MLGRVEAQTSTKNLSFKVNLRVVGMQSDSGNQMRMGHVFHRVSPPAFSYRSVAIVSTSFFAFIALTSVPNFSHLGGVIGCQVN